jgi:hypothetical protein
VPVLDKRAQERRSVPISSPTPRRLTSGSATSPGLAADLVATYDVRTALGNLEAATDYASRD